MKLTEIAFGMMLCLIPTGAFCADVSGVISDNLGKPVPGIKVIGQSSSGQPTQTAVSGQQGQYAIRNLAPGVYRFELDLAKTVFKKGDSVGSSVSDKGITLNWVVSPSTGPIALVEPGSAAQMAEGDPFGLSMSEFLSVVALGTSVVAGGVVGGYGAAGGFSGGAVTSPSR